MSFDGMSVGPFMAAEQSSRTECLDGVRARVPRAVAMPPCPGRILVPQRLSGYTAPRAGTRGAWSRAEESANPPRPAATRVRSGVTDGA